MSRVARVGIALVLTAIVAAAVPAMAQAIIYVKGPDISLPGPGAGLAVDQTTGDLFVGRPLSNPGAVDKFDLNGTSLGMFTTGLAAAGVAVGQPGTPDAGKVFVLDAGTSDGTPDINTFDSTGTPVGSPIAVDLTAFDPAQAPQIAAFAVDIFGLTPFLAYPNADDDVVDLFSGGASSGTVNTAPITLVDPRDVAAAANSNLYIVDAAGGGRVVKVTNPVLAPSASVLEGTTGATSVAVNPETEDVYVGIDNGSAFHVVVYDSSGEEIGDFGAGDFGDGNALPRDIAVDADTKTAYVSDSGATPRVVVYVEGGPPPTVTTMSASSVKQTTATLAGTVAQSGVSTVDSCRFEYTDDADFATNGFANAKQALCTAEYPTVGASLVFALANISGLDPDTTYHFRLLAGNSDGTGEGGDVVFETLPNAPTVETTAAGDVQQTRATLGGSVNPNGRTVNVCEIDFGTTTDYGQTRSCAPSPGGGTSAVGVNADVAGLAPGTTYHFRVRAANAGGATNGPDRAFRTVDKPHPCVADPESCKPTDQCVVTPAVCITAAKATLPGSAAVKAGKALIALTCKGSGGSKCKGTLRLRARIKRAGRKARTLTVGRVSYEVAAGQSKTLGIRLSRAARTRLASKGRLRIRASGTGVSGRAILLRLTPTE